MDNNNSISIIGGNARNKGALLMLYESLKIIEHKNYQKIYIFTPFPIEDEKLIGNILDLSKSSYEIIQWSTKEIIKSFFLALFPIKFNKIVNSLKNSRVTLDISGISFVEDRGFKYLIYNSLTIFIPYRCGSKIIKLPQSIGPIESSYYKTIASYFLQKCTAIYSRGDQSSTVLSNLGVKYNPSSDLGFIGGFDSTEIVTSASRIGIIPSIVVKKYFEEKKLNYENFLIELIGTLNKKGYKLTLFPQSYSPSSRKDTFDDSSIITYVSSKINTSGVEIINKDLSLEELCNIYRNLDICITSRFHGMIMAINSNVYPIVIGWNHKYEEVINDLNLTKSSIRIDKNMFLEVLNNLDQLINNYADEINILISNREKVSKNMQLIKKSIEAKL